MGALGHHVRHALAVVALFWLGWETALFGMVVQTSTVIASKKDNITFTDNIITYLQ